MDDCIGQHIGIIKNLKKLKMKKLSLFIAGSVFGFLVQDLATTSEYSTFLYSVIAGILIFFTIEIVMGIVISYKTIKAKKEGEAYAKSLFKNLDQHIAEKIGIDMAGDGEDKTVVVKAHIDKKKDKVVIDSIERFGKEKVEKKRKAFKKAIDEHVEKNFVYKSHLKTMTKKQLHKYATVYGKFEKSANEFTRKELIDWIVKHKMYITRKKSDNPN